MIQKYDLTGRRFGKLTVMAFAGRKGAHYTWFCKCDCGNESKVFATNLKRGLSTQCIPCGQNATAKKLKRTSYGAKSKEYISWSKMKMRCQNWWTKDYPLYGGRGIRVCDEWLNSFEAFIQHIGPCPSSAHSIDRINVNGNYEPGNVRWATIEEQANNKRNSRKVLLNGQSVAISHAAKESGLTYQEVRYYTLTEGMDVAEIARLKAMGLLNKKKRMQVTRASIAKRMEGK